MSDASPDSSAWRSVSFRLSLMLFVISAVAWLGGLVFRALMANELFIAGTLNFDPAVLPAQESMLYQLISVSTLVVNIAYVVVFVSAVLVLRAIPLRFKDHGWLLMAAILFFMFVPVEVFTAYLDITFVLLWEGTKDMIASRGLDAFIEARSELRATISHRIGALSGLPVMAMFCYVTAVVVIIWQPMRRKNAHGVPVSSSVTATVEAGGVSGGDSTQKRDDGLEAESIETAKARTTE